LPAGRLLRSLLLAPHQLKLSFFLCSTNFTSRELFFKFKYHTVSFQLIFSFVLFSVFALIANYLISFVFCFLIHYFGDNFFCVGITRLRVKQMSIIINSLICLSVCRIDDDNDVVDDVDVKQIGATTKLLKYPSNYHNHSR